MHVIFGFTLGIAMNAGMVNVFNGSRADGLLAYLCGFIIGWLVWDKAERKEVRK